MEQNVTFTNTENIKQTNDQEGKKNTIVIWIVLV